MSQPLNRATAERCEAILLRLDRESRDALEALRVGDLASFRARLRARDTLITDVSPLLDAVRASARRAGGRVPAAVRRARSLLIALQETEAELLAAVQASRAAVVEELSSIRQRASVAARYAATSAGPRSRIDLTR